MSSDSQHMAQLLAALDAADKAHDAAVQSGNSAKAAQIAQEASQLGAMINKTPTTNVVPPGIAGNTSGSAPPGKPKPGYSALSSGQDTLQVGPWDTGLKLPASTADQLAGMGKAFHDIGQGIGQKVGLTSAQDVHDTRDTDKQLMASGNGRFGNIAGNLAAFAPAAMIPGAQGVAATALTGGMLGAMQPNEGMGEQAENTGLGALSGPLAHTLPEAGRLISKIPGATPVGNFVSSIMPGGSDRTARRIMTTAASDGQNDPNLARLRLEQAAKSGALADKYGFQPTTAQVAQSPGIASLDRTVRTLPGVSSQFPVRDADNTAAVDKILQGISGTPQDRLRAGMARDFQARTMYDDALNNPEHFVQPPKPGDPSFDAELAAKSGLTQDGKPPVNDPNAPAQGLNDIGTRLQTLLERPAMQDAMTNASRIAANFGKPLDERNIIQQMHYAKMHLDDQIGAAQAAGKTNDFRALLDTKHELLGVMDDLSPAYAQARSNFQTASRPVNRLDVGEELRQKYTPGLGDAGGSGRNPATFVNAVRDGDSLAQRATGFNGATLSNTLKPEDLEALRAATDHLGGASFAQNAGRAVGSNTAQNLENQRMLNGTGQADEILGPEGKAALGVTAALSHPAALAPNIINRFSMAAAKKKIADALLDPEKARALLDPGIPTPSSAPGVATAIGASVNADQGAAGHADGGPVDPPIHKTTFWELAQQALKELTSPSDSPSTPKPNTSGYVASGSPGANFDNRVDQAVKDAGG